MHWFGKIVRYYILVGFLFISLPTFANEELHSGNNISYNHNEFANYMTNLKEKIRRNWTPPDILESGHAEVEFKINRQGEIYDVRISESSGNSLFDESTLNALEKISPFETFPNNTTRDVIKIKYKFDTSLVKTDEMREYVRKSDEYFNINNQIALKYINLAISEVEGDIGSYFLYGKRAKIKRAMGDILGADKDLQESKNLKIKYDRRRIMNCKLIAETEGSAFAYFYLANAYDIAGDYKNAIVSIDKAIELTELNNNYKRYKQELQDKAFQNKIE